MSIKTAMQATMSSGTRERDGLPWGFPDQPAPVPAATGTGFDGYGLWVL